MKAETGLTRDALSSAIGRIARKRGPSTKATLQKALEEINEMERLAKKYNVRLEPDRS